MFRLFRMLKMHHIIVIANYAVVRERRLLKYSVLCD